MKPKRRDIERRDIERRDIERRDIEGRDNTRRVTPELLDLHIKRAHAMREETFRDMGRAIMAWFVSCGMGRSKRNPSIPRAKK